MLRLYRKAWMPADGRNLLQGAEEQEALGELLMAHCRLYISSSSLHLQLQTFTSGAELEKTWTSADAECTDYNGLIDE